MVRDPRPGLVGSMDARGLCHRGWVVTVLGAFVKPHLMIDLYFGTEKLLHALLQIKNRTIRLADLAIFVT